MALALPVLVSVSAPAPLAAQDAAATPDYSEYDDAELFAALNEPGNAALRQACEIGQPVTQELLARGHAGRPLESFAELTRMYCAIEQDRHAEAYDIMRQLEQGDDLRGLDPLGLFLAEKTDDAAGALARLQRMGRENGGQALFALDPASFWQGVGVISREGGTTEEELDDFLLALFQRPSFRRFDDNMQGGIAASLVRTAIERDLADLLPSLLDKVRSPTTYVNMLAGRPYEAIWPQLEQRAGDNLATITAANREFQMARLAEEPEDRDRFSAAAHALYFDGQFEEAIALAREWRMRDGAMATIAEGDAWAMNIEAFALDALGRPEESDAVFDMLAGLAPEEHGWVVNFVINRASRLVAQARWEDGLAAADLAGEVAEEYGSSYARLIVVRDKVCALVNLGRSGEIAPHLAFLRDNTDASIELASQALLCAGLAEEAAQLVLDGLAEESTRDSVVAGLQAPQFELFYLPSVLPEMRDLMAPYPEIRSRFEEHARMIPDRFVPRASLRRKDRPLPTS